jgi:N-acetylglucosamine kinase-like BadF-type ATPase
VLGDEGSGYWIGLEAVRAGLHAHDRIGAGGSPSTLLPAIQAEWEVDSLAELVALGNQRSGLKRPAPDFATLAPVVARCADAGDALAAEVLVRAGEELAGQIAVVSRKMSAACATTSHSVGVAYTGSVLSHIVRVREAMIERLVTLVPEATVLNAPVDSLEGALWRARRGRVASIMPAPTR